MIVVPNADCSAFTHEVRAASLDMAVRLARFGLDLRARSALSASFRSLDVTLEQRGEQLLEALRNGDTAATASEASLRGFLHVFAELPEADFATDWLEHLTCTWRTLRNEGCSADLPLRTAQALAVVGSQALLAGRTGLSALEVEIVNALMAGGLCAVDFLRRMDLKELPAAMIGQVNATAEDQLLLTHLGSMLQEARGETVGLLGIRLRLQSVALTLQRDQRAALVDAALQVARTVLRETDVVIRTDAHAFAVVMPALQSHAQVRLAAGKLAQSLAEPLSVAGTATRASFVLGAVWSPAHGESATELIRCVDIALETARHEDRNVVLFDEQMLAATRHEAMIEKEFMVALESGDLELHVQPQIAIATRRCVGGELLLRWKDSSGAAVPAASIPDVALRVGAAGALTRWLIFGACRMLSELLKAGVDIQLSVNLLARDLMDDQLPLLVDQAIRLWRVPPEKLMFELIESAVLEDPAVGAKVMNRLIDLGVSTSIDDFGIGYSSILYLRRLPLDELKIDRAFVDVMFRSPEDREIVATLIRLAHGLGLTVVAEGVENEETLKLLHEMQCDRAQGYWISAAMPASVLPEWFDAWNAEHAVPA